MKVIQDNSPEAKAIRERKKVKWSAECTCLNCDSVLLVNDKDVSYVLDQLAAKTWHQYWCIVCKQRNVLDESLIPEVVSIMNQESEKDNPPSDDVEWGIVERKFVTQYDDFGDAYGPSLYGEDDKDYVNVYGWVKK